MAQPVGVGDHRQAGSHRGGGDHRAEQEAEDRVEHPGGDRDAERVVDEGEERFWRMLRIVARDSDRGDHDPRRSPEISVTSDASMATSVPVPIAMPTSAWARAGASLIPSPTMPTQLAFVLQPAHLERLVLGQHLGEHAVDADLSAIASAVRRLSPVIITTSRPRRCSSATAAAGIRLRPCRPRR